MTLIDCTSKRRASVQPEHSCSNCHCSQGSTGSRIDTAESSAATRKKRRKKIKICDLTEPPTLKSYAYEKSPGSLASKSQFFHNISKKCLRKVIRSLDLVECFGCFVRAVRLVAFFSRHSASERVSSKITEKKKEEITIVELSP